MTAKKSTKKRGRTTAPKGAAGTPPIWDAEDMFAAYEPITNKLKLCLKSDLADDVVVTEAKAKQATETSYQYPANEIVQKLKDEAVAAHEAAKERALENTVEFRFVSLPRTMLEALAGADEHRPTQAHQDQHKADCKANGLPFRPLPHNPDTFPPALMAASCVHPELSLEQATRIWEDWGDGQAAVIYDHCHSAQKLVK